MPPDEPNDEERREELPEDNETPFRPSPPTRDDSTQPASTPTLDDTHPITDTDIDQQELYDEGLSGATEAEEPNTGNDVVDFKPKP